MATDSVVQITIPVSIKLDRENFLTWRSQVEPIIHGFGLFHHIDNVSSPPEKNLIVSGVSQSNLKFLLWNKQDQLLLGWLRSTISGPILSQYVAFKTANSLWQALHRVYSAISSARVMDLRRSLQTRARGGQACSEYYAQMVNLADQLAAAGAPIPESDLVQYILAGLGSDFNSFAVAITTRFDPISLSDLHGFLLSHENLLTSQHHSTSTFSADPVALYSVPSNRGRGRGSGRGSNRGRYGSGRSAGQQGKGSGYEAPLLPTPVFPPTGRGGPVRSHSTRGASTQHFNSNRGAYSSSQLSTDRPTCQVCRKKGHEALECWYRYDAAYNSETAAHFQTYYNT